LDFDHIILISCQCI